MAIAVKDHLLLFHLRPGDFPAPDPAPFLCPRCFTRLYGPLGIEPRPCRHVLLVRDGREDVYWRDGAIRALSRLARRVAKARSESPVDVLREYLGPELVVYELLEWTRDDPRSVAFVIEYPGVLGNGRQAA